MQSDKMCPVTLGNHKTKTPIGRHPWQPPTPAGFEQGVPWRSPCEHSNSSRIRAHATQNAVRQNAFRYLRNPYKTMLWSGSETPEHQQVRFRNTRTPAGCEHTPRKTHAKKLFHVTFGTHKKQSLLWSGSETPMPKNSFTSPLEPIKNNALPMRKT